MDNRRKIGDINSSLQDTLAGKGGAVICQWSCIGAENLTEVMKISISKDANYRCMGSWRAEMHFSRG